MDGRDRATYTATTTAKRQRRRRRRRYTTARPKTPPPRPASGRATARLPTRKPPYRFLHVLLLHTPDIFSIRRAIKRVQKLPSSASDPTIKRAVNNRIAFKLIELQY